MFAYADPVITRALAHYIADNDADASRILQAYFPGLQPAIAMRALELGKPVFAEKPIAAGLADAEAMARAAAARRGRAPPYCR